MKEVNQDKPKGWEERFNEFIGKPPVYHTPSHQNIQGEYIEKMINIADLKSFIRTLLAEKREEIGESHNLETKYNSISCELTEHYPIWDGQYYTCQFCGKEFVKKDEILSILS